ncbi:MAG: sugar kinase [Verrucomicrobia bacterium Tous-C9LFEB]|nr:MAG: sugar kinase [Verrucomicrobia bacterium Tous-C9LFEB]
MSVLVVGSIALDDVKTPAAEHKDLLGGSASYAAVAASFYGPVRLVGVVGEDFPPEHRALFNARQIDVEGLEIVPGKTFRWSGEYEENLNNRKTLSIALNVFEKFEPKLPAKWKQTEFILLGNIAPSLQLQVLKQVEHPKFIIADTMDLWINLAKADLLELLKKIDMLILNDSEVKLLTGENNLIRAGRAVLKLGPKYVIVKKGEHGALLFGAKTGEFFSTSAVPLEDIHDPTGAGDCFAGAFVGSLAQLGDTSFASLKKAVIQGTLVASFNVEEFSLRRLEKLTREEIAARETAFMQSLSIV